VEHGRPGPAGEAAFSTFVAMVTRFGEPRAETGRRVSSKLDLRKCGTAVERRKAEIGRSDFRPHAFCGEWNYELQPREAAR
jgi:hypothetical protein